MKNAVFKVLGRDGALEFVVVKEGDLRIRETQPWRLSDKHR